MNDEPFDKETIKDMVNEAHDSMTLKERITMFCILFLSASAGIAFLLLAYTLAKHANLF